MNTPIFEENDLDNFKGIDIMRAVRSFDPCLPCGVHMYLGKGKVLKKVHSPTQVADRHAGLLTAPDDRRERCQPQNLRAVGDRIEQLLDELHAVADPRALDDRRGAAASRHRAVRRRARTRHGARVRGRARSRPAPGRRRAGRQPAGRARPAPRRPRRRGSSGRSSGPAVPRRARRRRRAARHRPATPARCTCGCSAAATGARRRR